MSTKKSMAGRVGQHIPNYREILEQREEDKRSENLDLDVEAGRLAMDTAIHNCNKRIFTSKKNLLETKRIVPLNVDAVLAAQNELELQHRELKKMQDMKEELFP